LKNLEKIIKEAKSSNKYKEGIKEVKSNIKGSKLIIISTSLNNDDKQSLEKASGEYKVPIYYYDDNSSFSNFILLHDLQVVSNNL